VFDQLADALSGSNWAYALIFAVVASAAWYAALAELTWTAMSARSMSCSSAHGMSVVAFHCRVIASS